MRMLALLLLAMGIGCSEPCAAGALTGRIIALDQFEIAGGQGFLRVSVSNVLIAQPACEMNGNNMVLDLRTEHGRAMATLAISAGISGASVRVYGNNTCIAGTNTETATEFFIDL